MQPCRSLSCSCLSRVKGYITHTDLRPSHLSAAHPVRWASSVSGQGCRRWEGPRCSWRCRGLGCSSRICSCRSGSERASASPGNGRCDTPAGHRCESNNLQKKHVQHAVVRTTVRTSARPQLPTVLQRTLSPSESVTCSSNQQPPPETVQRVTE